MGIFDFLYDDPSEGAIPYLQQIPHQTKPYFEPFIQRGERAGQNLETQYGNLLNDPGGTMNRMGQSYQQSPGFDFALKRAMESGNRSAAAGGMAGSPMHQEHNMGVATQMANQDYNTWLEHALGLYGKGLSGSEGMYGKGYDASKSMSDMIAQALASQAGMQFAGTSGRNKMIQDIVSSFIKAGGQAAGAAMGGGAF